MPEHSAVRPPVASASSSRRHLVDLVAHLAQRQLESMHRFTLLGWLWPLVRQLAQLAVLVFLFSNVLDLGIPDFPLFVFAGLLVWTWFQSAVTAATSVLQTQRHLVFSPRFPTIALPLVAVVVPLVDVLIALPVLLVALAVEGHLSATAVLLPVLLALQFVLIGGVALLAAPLSVYFRDVPNLVAVGLLLLFYFTPVFYGLKNVPERFQWLLQINPLTPLVNAVRAVLLEGRLPAAGDVLTVAAVAAALAAAGLWAFRALEPDLVDEL
jgi:lipopolysaccharide transport system permease protein